MRSMSKPGDSRAKVAALLARGYSQAAISRELGLSRGAVSFHVRKLGVPADPRFARRHDWDEIQRFYDDGHTLLETRQRFGFSTKTWFEAVRRGAIVPRPAAMPIEQLCSAPRSRSHLKNRLIEAGLLEPVCAVCGIDSWLGAPLSLALHHVNGDGADNRLQNLQLLCPNCHSQTENFAGRNRRRLRLVEDRETDGEDAA
jgi:hypothetical protein